MISRTLLLLAGTLSIAAWVPITAVSAEGSTDTPANINGIVLDSNGNAASGAMVMIWTAGVKQGYSTYCPSCYVDCGKRDTTDGKGGFTLPNLSRDLKFRLLIVKQGFQPAFVSDVDPLEKNVIVNIHPRHLPEDPMQVVRGRVVDVAGNPVHGATITPEMVWYKTEDGRVMGRGGAVKGLEPLAVSNGNGEFEITYVSPVVKMTLMIRARGLAPARFKELPGGGERHELELNIGSTVYGRLIHHGQPVGNAEIGLLSKSRSMLEFFPEERVGTERDGTFTFSNVPAGNKWLVYAKMDSTVGLGTTDTVELSTVQDGENIDVGDLEIIPGFRLSGQVVLSDGKPISEGMRMFISCERAWDSKTVVLPPDGRFTVGNLRLDNYSISPSVKGYKLSDSNPNLSSTIEGLIDRDVDDFIIVLDPGKSDYAGRGAGMFRDIPLKSATRY